MFDKLKKALMPNLISLGLMIGGWYLSITSIAVSASLHTGQSALIDGWRLLGLAMIIAGAYFPRIASLFGKDK